MVEIMRLREVAEYLHVRPYTVYRLIKRQRLPAFRLGSDWRFDRELVDQWRRNQEDKK